MKSFKIKLFVLVISLVFLSINYNVYPQNNSIVRNGSFEKHKPGQYPIHTTPHIGYKKNQLMKCIGFCKSSDIDFGWPPTSPSMGCDDNDANSPSYDGGWYWATNEASPDYFHLNGVGVAKSPYISAYKIDKHTYKWENRYPYGYRMYGPNYFDSAFVGIRFDVRYPDFRNYHNPKFTNYKEYIQSRLSIPLVGPSKYHVKFFVSKSKHSIPSIKKLGAYFSDTAIQSQHIFKSV
ncbi:MAG TPA: hypothetical protein PLE30_03495 [Candidatus Kapabacteria bacterium]|nr:hypothetical protein [Candidatus Kapabacteria bacterium]